MSASYYVCITLALFTGAMPAQILGIMWESVIGSMEVEIPYIAILRLLGGCGAVAAAILSDRIRGYILARDVVVGSIALEALCLMGFSMSREFWSLCVWTAALGFSAGLCFTLICYLIRETDTGKACLMFASSPLGILAGVYLVKYILSIGRSWHTACQVLSIVQIILCMILFLMRRVLLKDMAAIVKKHRRAKSVLRQRRREQLIRERGDVDERSEGAYLMRLFLLYGASAVCSLLLLSAVHLSYSAQVAGGDMTADLARCYLPVCLGIAAGRCGIHFMGKNAARAWGPGSGIAILCLAFCTAAAWMGHTGALVFFLLRFGTGAGAGMIFPNLIQEEDERFDTDAQTAMAGLLPAFYLGGEAVITPFVQSMSGSREAAVCASAMLALACLMGLCLLLASVRFRRK